MAEEGAGMDAETAERLLAKGAMVLKFGRRGKPKRRFLFAHDDALKWADKPGKKAHRRQVPLTFTAKVQLGHHTPNFARYAKKHADAYHRSLSVVSDYGGVDVAFDTEQECHMWAAALNAVLQDRRERAHMLSRGEHTTLPHMYEYDESRTGQDSPPRRPGAVLTGLASVPEVGGGGKREDADGVDDAPSDAEDVKGSYQQPPRPAPSHGRYGTGGQTHRASSRRKLHGSFGGDAALEEALLHNDHLGDDMTAPGSQLGPAALHFPSGVSPLWVVVTALTMAGQGAAFAYLATLLHKGSDDGDDALHRIAHPIPIAILFGLLFAAFAALPACRSRRPCFSPLWYVVTIAAVAAYLVAAAIVAYAMLHLCGQRATDVCVPGSIVSISVHQAVLGTAAVLYAMQRLFRTCAIDDCLQEVLEAQASAVSFDALDAASLLILATAPGAHLPTYLSIMAQSVAVAWLFVLFLRITYSILAHAHLDAAIWKLPAIGLDPLRVQNRVLTKVPGMHDTLEALARLGFRRFRQQPHFATTAYLGQDALAVFQRRMEHLFWPEERKALSRHLLASWGPLQGDETLVCTVDNVRTAVAARLRYLLGIVAAPAEVTALAVRITAAVVMHSHPAVWTVAVDFALKNLARLLTLPSTLLSWRRITAFLNEPPPAAARDMLLRPWFVVLAVVWLLGGAVATDWALSQCSSAHAAAHALPAQQSCFLATSIPLSNIIVFDAAMALVGVAAAVVAVAAVYKCRCMRCHSNDPPTIVAARADATSMLMCTVATCLQATAKALLLYFALPFLRTSDAPAAAAAVAYNYLRAVGVVGIAMVLLGSGVAGVWHPMRTMARDTACTQVAMDIAGAASLFWLSTSFADDDNIRGAISILVLSAAVLEAVYVPTARQWFTVTAVAPVLDATTAPQLVASRAKLCMALLPAQVALLALRAYLLATGRAAVGLTITAFLVRSVCDVCDSLAAVAAWYTNSNHARLRCCVPTLQPRPFRLTDETDDSGNSMAMVIKRILAAGDDHDSDSSLATHDELRSAASTMLHSRVT